MVVDDGGVALEIQVSEALDRLQAMDILRFSSLPAVLAQIPGAPNSLPTALAAFRLLQWGKVILDERDALLDLLCRGRSSTTWGLIDDFWAFLYDQQYESNGYWRSSIQGLSTALQSVGKKEPPVVPVIDEAVREHMLRSLVSSYSCEPLGWIFLEKLRFDVPGDGSNVTEAERQARREYGQQISDMFVEKEIDPEGLLRGILPTQLFKEILSKGLLPSQEQIDYFENLVKEYNLEWAIAAMEWDGSNPVFPPHDDTLARLGELLNKHWALEEAKEEKSPVGTLKGKPSPVRKQAIPFVLGAEKD